MHNHGPNNGPLRNIWQLRQQQQPNGFLDPPPWAAAKTKRKIGALKRKGKKKISGSTGLCFIICRRFYCSFLQFALDIFRHLLSAAESAVARSVSEPDTELCSLHEWTFLAA